MTRILPPRLKPGDRVAAVTLSWGGPGMYPHRYEAGKRQFEQEFGVEVVEMPHTMRDADWIWRNPKARADDLMQAFADRSIHGIISTIGGDDSVRILPFLYLEVIRSNPKIFMGYSDTTVTHMACHRAGLVSFYGPSFMAGFGENAGMFPYMVDSVRRTLFSGDAVGTVHPNQDGWMVEHLDWAEPATQNRKRKLTASTSWRYLQGAGIRRGHLLGGCADVLEFLKGTEWWPPLHDWEGAILFYETSEDAPTPAMVTWWLRNFASQGIVQKLNGILFARPGGNMDPVKHLEYDAAILRVVRDEIGLTDLPIISNMDFGHTDPGFVLPCNTMAEINCAENSFSIVEPSVR